MPRPYLPHPHPRHTPTKRPGRWMEGTRAQIPQCLGRDYLAHPPVTMRVCLVRATVASLSCPQAREGWPRDEQLSAVSTLGLLGSGSPGASVSTEAPSIWKFPREHRFRSLGMGPGLWALQGGREGGPGARSLSACSLAGPGFLVRLQVTLGSRRLGLVG